MKNRVGCPLAWVAVAITGSSVSAGPQDTFKWDGNIPIPDNDGFVFAQIIVPDDPDGPRAIADLDVDLIILHPWQGDLIVELEHVDDGLRVPLLYRPGDSDGTGAGFSADNIGSPATGGKFIFDDEGGEFYDGLPPDGIGNVPHPGIADVTGPWIPYGSQVSGLTRTLSSFDGHDRRGTWRLWVSDNEPEDTGSILNWAYSSALEGSPPSSSPG